MMGMSRDYRKVDLLTRFYLVILFDMLRDLVILKDETGYNSNTVRKPSWKEQGTQANFAKQQLTSCG